MQLTLPTAVLLAATAASAQTFSFPLNTEQTNPSAVFPDGATLPSGFATVTVDDDLDLVSYDIAWQDLTGPIVAPGFHFHGPAALGENAGTIIDVAGDTPTGFDPVGGIVELPLPASGSISGEAQVDQITVDAILNGLAYINIHTDLNQPGELRGQVVVPEPTGLGLLLVGGLALRRRR